MKINIPPYALTAMKIALAVGTAAILLVPYKIEKDAKGETKYHAPLYKLSYGTHFTASGKVIHTFTIDGFGLISDQIGAVKRMYKALLLRGPYLKENARRAGARVADVATGVLSFSKK